MHTLLYASISVLERMELSRLHLCGNRCDKIVHVASIEPMLPSKYSCSELYYFLGFGMMHIVSVCHELEVINPIYLSIVVGFVSLKRTIPIINNRPNKGLICQLFCKIMHT